jgi:hypothetical protein
MIRRILFTALGLLLPPLAGSGAAQAACTRASLQSAIDRYEASQAMGDPQSLPLALGASYAEQGRPMALSRSLLTQPLKVDYQHSLLDVKQCETFTELGVTTPGHPYVVGTQLLIEEDVIHAVNSLIADGAQGMVDADGYIRHALDDDWDVLPREQRSSRDGLIAAANAFLDHLSDPAVPAPWGSPCRRMQDGRPVDSGTAEHGCDAKLPRGLLVRDRHFIVDESHGAVAVVGRLGSDASPIVHLLRLVDGRIRSIRSLSLCGASRCGPPPS